MKILNGIFGFIAFFMVMMSVIVGTVFVCIFVLPIYAVMRGLDEHHH
jgi:hypothetical protein